MSDSIRSVAIAQPANVVRLGPAIVHTPEYRTTCLFRSRSLFFFGCCCRSAWAWFILPPVMAEVPADAGAAASGADEVDIKFVIVPEGFSHSRRFARTLTLTEMKSQVEEDLRIPVASMKLMFAGQGAPSQMFPLIANKMLRVTRTPTARASINNLDAP